MSFAAILSWNIENPSTGRAVNILLFITFRTVFDRTFRSRLQPRPRSEDNATWNSSVLANVISNWRQNACRPGGAARICPPVIWRKHSITMKFLQVVKQKNGKISFGFFATMGGSCAAIRRRFLSSLVTLAESDAQANKIDSARWGHHEPIDRACELDFLIPSSALEDLELVARRPGWVRERCRRIRRKPIEAPLPDVAVHVV